MESQERDERTAAALERYRPPYDLTADMLVVPALCPTAPLRQTFPRVPFLAVRGKTPLVLWFSRITEVCYCDAAGERRCEGGPETALYNELNIIALLHQRAFFVPGIYATGERTIRIGHRYGMPKQLTSMHVQVHGTHFEASMMDSACQSFVRARLLGSGRGVAQMVSRLWPRQLWPARFPAGTQVRAMIQATPRVHVAHVRRGQLCLDTPWLPQAVSLLPVGLYLPRLRMRLPP
jgi:hypothetical protein